MPAIVVGADTTLGRAIVDELLEPDREVRAFVTDPRVAEELKAMGVKVALGDVSDASHVAGASTRCFSAILVIEASTDDRERSFARTPTAVIDGWIQAVTESEVSRVIWVGADHPVPGIEWASVAADAPDAAARVAQLDDAAEL